MASVVGEAGIKQEKGSIYSTLSAHFWLLVSTSRVVYLAPNVLKVPVWRMSIWKLV